MLTFYWSLLYQKCNLEKFLVSVLITETAHLLLASISSLILLLICRLIILF